MPDLLEGLKAYKYWLISQITPENKKEINKQTRKIDKDIKKLLELKKD